MVWISDGFFTENWLRRAERGKACIDDGDRFVSLWIAFNSWMKGNFGEAVKDATLVDRVKRSEAVQQIFDNMKNDREFGELLHRLSTYEVVDMRYPNESAKFKRYDGHVGSLMDVLYQVRCNLFHGRKDVQEDRKDIELVSLSYNILLPLLKSFLRTNSSLT